jgi:diguanylate cyclase (GGDEF)-like protein
LPLAEKLILLAGGVILMALIVLGGVEGTGLYWAYTFPFLAFFIQGQKRGWWYSLAFVALIGLYFGLLQDRLSFSYWYPAQAKPHFVLSLCFYTLVAAAFNLLRGRFEKRLQARVDENTGAARQYLAQLQALATHDSLTRLPNRVRLLEQLTTSIEQAHASSGRLLLCNVRVERLFELGNVLDSDGADNLVRQVALRLAQGAGGGTVLARTRRDEFVLLVSMGTSAPSHNELGAFVSDERVSVTEQGYALDVELTWGFCLYPDHASDAQQLLKKAEQAMLQARKQGKVWSVYDAAQEQLFIRHHLLFGKLREALQSGLLTVHYQPQYELSSRRLIGAEALMRWHDTAEGWISPEEFIPVAEESGLIRPLTAWLLEQCVQQCAHWHRLGLDLNLSINLSATSLSDPALLETLLKLTRAADLPPARLHLELTESCFIVAPDRTLDVMQQLHAAGFKLSIDDFGTGFSSLSYLKNMPISELKIDQGFVRDLLENASDQAIVSSTIDLAHNFGLTVVAEGVEDEATAEWLRSRLCDVGQGFGFARPMPAADLLQLATQA